MNQGQANDRVLDSLQDWQKKEKNLVSVFGERVLQQREFMKEKLRLYKEAYYGHRPSSNKDEKLTLAILSGEIDKLERKVYPNLIQRLFVQLNDFVVNLLRPAAEIPELTLQTFNPQKKETPASKLRTENGERQSQKNEQESLSQKNKLAAPEAIYLADHQKTKMGNAHELSEEAVNAVRSALSKNENWLAYSDDRYFLGQGDLYFFKSKDEAKEFAVNNISDRESFHVLHFKSLDDVYQKLPNAEKQRIDPDANPLHNHDGNAFADALIEHIEEKQNSNNLKQTFMQEQNFEYLKKQIKFTGFGEGMDRELREKMGKQTPDFTLMHKAQFGNEQTEAVLHFKKSAENDMYFFNRYFLQLKNEKGDEAFTQSFRVGRENNITLKEAYNLMNGRAIHKEHTPKEGEKYNAWFQLNFKETDEMGEFKMKQFHQNYGFDLKASLAKYPIKELENAESANNLIKSLERGNRQSVTVMQDGKEQKMFIEASPQFKSINVFNDKGSRVNLKAEPQNQSQAQKQTTNEKQTENLSERKSLGQVQTESKTENQSQTNGKKLNNKEGVKVDDNGGTKQTRRHSKKHSLH